MSSETESRFVPQYAGWKRQQRNNDADQNRTEQPTIGVSGGDESPECNDPGAQAIQFEAMRTVAKDVAECRPVTENRTEVEKASGFRLRLHRREQPTGCDHHERAEPRDDERSAPAQVIGDKLRDEKRQADADRKARRVECDA